MEKQELRKITMDCVENCGYKNLLLSRVVARVFSLKSTPQHLWVMWVYIVWVQKLCIKQDDLAKQNVSRVSRRKALSASYLRNTAVSICADSSHSSHVQGTCIISRDAQSRATRENYLVFNCLSLHTLSLSHNSYN